MRVQDAGCRAASLGPRVQGVGFRDIESRYTWGSTLRANSQRSRRRVRVQDAGCRTLSPGTRVQVSGFRDIRV